MGGEALQTFAQAIGGGVLVGLVLAFVTYLR